MEGRKGLAGAVGQKQNTNECMCITETDSPRKQASG